MTAHSTASVPELVKKHASAKVFSHQPLAQPFLLGNGVKVLAVCQTFSAAAFSAATMVRVAVAEGVDGHAGMEKSR